MELTDIKLVKQIMPYKLTELDKKIYKYLLTKKKKGVPQNVLWKELGITSRDASRSLKKLEALGLVKRESIVYEGRRTFLVKPVKKKLEEVFAEEKRISRPVLSLNGFIEIPCMYCPHINTLCYEGGYYDPRYCDLLITWVREKSIKKKQN